jgi:hypothetical protein
MARLTASLILGLSKGAFRVLTMMWSMTLVFTGVITS